MARLSPTMVTAIPFLRLRDGTHPLAAGPGIPASCTGRADRDGTAGRCRKTWDPADESLAGQPARASADSEVRPGPRPQTLRPHQVKTPQAGPRSEDYPHPPCRFGRGWHHAFRAAGRTHGVGFCAVPVMPAGRLAEYGRLSAAGSSAWALEDWHGHRGQLRRLAPPGRLRRTGA